MTIYRIVELDEFGIQNGNEDFKTFEECSKAYKKRIRYWRNVQKKGQWLNFKAIENTPFSASFYQDNKIKWTWEMTVIPEKTI